VSLLMVNESRVLLGTRRRTPHALKLTRATTVNRASRATTRGLLRCRLLPVILFCESRTQAALHAVRIGLVSIEELSEESW